MFIEAIKILSEKEDITSLEAIILGNAQERNIYKKLLTGLVEQYRLIKIIKFVPCISSF